ncbi:hypothetical protein [Flammeovirga kamogawensis]|uniref:Lipoprotein n=1 Tax=Flammeovirga kamogawensis TaxID=373891 RepID=A0ABX8H1P8_9BACT|nr:hypothetical protein [Flammeovirga kamogawensis]MBB6463592.1 hypothetical protein [Flammeovirga kamogawensis]QWG09819.1 hypothetical protein KM029_19250 [Flammeovirga kamogawensis]TRX65327.1 hypothetical protein EO216_22655 [Flammeovirga kamogawensis]
MKRRINQVLLTVLGVAAFSSCASTDLKNNDNTSVSVEKKSQPASNPWLISDKMATTHFDMAQSDNFEAPIKSGIFTIDPLTTQRIVAGPVNIITLKSQEEGFWWALSTDKITYVDGRNGDWKKVAVYQLPQVAQINDENLEAIIGTSYSDSATLATNYDKYWAPTKAQNPTLRMLTGNSIYAFVDKDGNLYFTASGHIHKLKFAGDRIDEVKTMNVKDQMAIPKELEQYIDMKLIPGGITGAQIAYDGTVIVGTIFGLIALDNDLSEIKDNIALPIEAFYSTFPPKGNKSPEFISNSFAMDENNAIYLASGVMMNKIVWNGNNFSTEAKDGAWSVAYKTGALAPTIKYGTGTGSTPTLMGFGNDEDKLVVITDGANKMHLTAFWRDRQDDGNQLADAIEVNCGYGENIPEFIQSEQSVATLGYGAFVVNNIAPKHNGLRDYDPVNRVNDLIFNVLAVGPIVEAGKGIEKFEWDTKTNKWTRQWANTAVASTSMVPTVSSTSEVVLVNTYNQQNGWEILGFDWNTGELVHEVNFGKTSYGNGAYALIQYDKDGNLIFNGIGGSMKVELK